MAAMERALKGILEARIEEGGRLSGLSSFLITVMVILSFCVLLSGSWIFLRMVAGI